MKSANIQRPLVERVAVFLLTLPRKQQNSSNQTNRDFVQLAQAVRDQN